MKKTKKIILIAIGIINIIGACLIFISLNNYLLIVNSKNTELVNEALKEEVKDAPNVTKVILGGFRNRDITFFHNGQEIKTIIVSEGMHKAGELQEYIKLNGINLENIIFGLISVSGIIFTYIVIDSTKTLGMKEFFYKVKKIVLIYTVIFIIFFCVIYLLLTYYYYGKKDKVIETNDKNYNSTLINNTKIYDIARNIIIDFSDSEKSVIHNNIPEIHEEDNDNEKEILYKKKIDTKKSIRVVNHGAILAQRSVIGIEKTNDGGKTWNNQLETTDGYMQIHNGSKFVFINENIGFINDPGLAGTNGENRGLLVTTDGGRNFKDCVIESDRIEDNLYIDDVPCMENNKLKLKAYTIENYDKKYYYFYSEDNGINWKQIHEINIMLQMCEKHVII